MPRISTVVVFRATFALVLFILMGQVLLFTLTRCRGLGDEDLDAKKREKATEVPKEELLLLRENIRRLKLDVTNLKRENDVLSSVVRDLATRNEDISKELNRLKGAEKITIAQELSKVKSQAASGEFLKGQPLRTEFEVVPFDGVAFNAIYQIYHELTGNPAERPYGFKGKDYLEVMKFAIDALNNYEGKDAMEVSARDLVDGIMRVDRIVGSQYDFYFKSTNNKVFHRVKIERPFGPLNLAGSIETIDTNNELINLILPLSGRINKFRTFLDNFVDVCVRWDRSVFLTVVFFGQESKEELKTIMRNVSKAENFTDYKLIFTDEPFSRGYGLQQGAVSWEKGNVLMFFCDVDVYFSAGFLDRCRFYSTPGVKVYYPVVFSLYNPMIVYGGSPPPQNQYRINRDTGYWRDFGYGMTCQYKNDFINIGGFDLSIKGWGMEDVKLYRSYLASNLVVIRAADRGVFHTWHPKFCSRNLTQAQFLACIKSKVRSEASQSQLGLLAFGGKIFDEKETNWIEQLQASKNQEITKKKD